MAQGTLTINTEKLLPIIKKWLYSEKDIFLRELVSNACDALSKLKILIDQKHVACEDDLRQIDIQINKEQKTLTISDTGIGMTQDEVERYIAQLAFSGAEEFLSKYNTQEEKDQVIGHFGLGFYSAYMVASKVEIHTLSYQKEAQAAFWSCDGTSSYTLEEGTKAARGTDIILFLEDEEYLEEYRVREILQKFCAFLPYPIYLNGTHINPKEPLWLKAPADCEESDYLEFYRQLFPLDPDPIFWVHLNVDYPYRLKGILYFPKIHQRYDFQKNAIKLFCNRVFVSDSCQDLIPEYLTILKGVVDSPDIPLNVSRSYLQTDKTVKQVSTHISKKVTDRLLSLYQTDLSAFTKAWEDIELIVKLGILHDDKFYEKAKDFLLWKNLEDNWTTLAQYLERHPGKVFYTHDPDASFVNVYKEQSIEVLIAKGPIDTPLINFLEMKLSPTKFQRVDGGFEAILDQKREKSLLDADGRPEFAKIADYVRSALNMDQIEVEAKSLASDKLPAFIMLNEETRRMRETLALSNSKAASFPDKKTFVVNTNSPLINALAQHKNQDLAKEILLHLYQLSQLAQKELPPKELSSFIERSSKVLEKLLVQEN